MDRTSNASDSDGPPTGPESTTIVVAGSKGGVGKTTTSINLAASLAERDESVVLVELDLATANFVDFLDIPVDDPGEESLHEVLAGEASLYDAVYEVAGKFDVVPSGSSLGGYADADLDALASVLDRLEAAYDVVVVDTGAGVTRATVEPFGLADQVLVVSTPRVASVRDAKKTKELVARAGGTVGGLVLTMSGTGASPDPDRIAEFLGLDLLTHVPDDPAVPHSQDRGVPVVTATSNSKAAVAYSELAVWARDVARPPAERRPIVAGTSTAAESRDETPPVDETADTSATQDGTAVQPTTAGGSSRQAANPADDPDEPNTAPRVGQTVESASEFTWGRTDDESSMASDDRTEQAATKSSASSNGHVESASNAQKDASDRSAAAADPQTATAELTTEPSDSNPGTAGQPDEESNANGDQQTVLGRITSLLGTD